jgi:hypothetical protein
MTITLNSKIPAGSINDKWNTYKEDAKLVAPGNKRKFKVIVVGSGLAGASAAATMAELGYQVDVFTFHDSPRRAHSIAAQGGINAAKNYQGDGDSVHRLFYDTIKGGDFRAREANVHRLAEVSVNIIDQMVAQGVPFAREYGGLLDNRSFGGAQVSRTFYARGQTGQQLLLGAYQQMARQIGLGNVRLFNRTELVDVVTVDDRCAGTPARLRVARLPDRTGVDPEPTRSPSLEKAVCLSERNHLEVRNRVEFGEPEHGAEIERIERDDLLVLVDGLGHLPEVGQHGGEGTPGRRVIEAQRERHAGAGHRLDDAVAATRNTDGLARDDGHQVQS